MRLMQADVGIGHSSPMVAAVVPCAVSAFVGRQREVVKNPAFSASCSFASHLGVYLSGFVFREATLNFNSNSHPYQLLLKGQFLPYFISPERLPGLFPFKNVFTSKGQRNRM